MADTLVMDLDATAAQQYFAIRTTPLVAAVILCGLVIVVLQAAFATDIPKVKGIPELPGARPFIGHLHLHGGVSGVNDGVFWSRWGARLGSELLQVRFGNKRVVIANTFQTVRELFVTNARQTSGRPNQYIFKHFVGLDMGTSSLTDSIKRQRNAGLKSTQPRQWPSYYSMLSREAHELLQEIVDDSDFGTKSLVVLEKFRKLSMNIAFQLTFAKRFKHTNDPWLQKYISNAKMITKVRGASATWIDFVPLLRMIPGARRDAVAAGIASHNREDMIAEVLEQLQQRIANGEEVHCIASSVLQDKESALPLRDAVKCCMSMMQGGLETIPSHLYAGLGGLLSPRGLEIQQRAYKEIRKVYDSDTEAIENCFLEEKVPYVVAIYKEMLRYYTIVPFSLPRETISNVSLKSGGHVVEIPAGTYVYMNSEGGNHDPQRFGPDADIFRPERWLENPDLSGPGMPHYSYGVGSRICPAWQISNRILYGLLMRLIVAFRMLPDEDMPPPSDWLTYGATPQGVANAPKLFKTKFVPRDAAALKSQLENDAIKYDDRE